MIQQLGVLQVRWWGKRGCAALDRSERIAAIAFTEPGARDYIRDQCATVSSTRCAASTLS